MRIAVIADLHGNKAALEALDKDLARTQPDEIWCLGDMVGKGPDSDLTADWALSHCGLMLKGNWEHHLAAHTFGERDRYYYDKLGDRLETLGALPAERVIRWNGINMRLIHGREITPGPLPPTIPEEEWEPYFTASDGTVCQALIYADVHRPALRVMKAGWLINCGSIGNGLGQPVCGYALLEGDRGDEKQPLDVRFRLLDYDREDTVRRVMAEEGLPAAEHMISEVRTGLYRRRRAAAGESGK